MAPSARPLIKALPFAFILCVASLQGCEQAKVLIPETGAALNGPPVIDSATPAADEINVGLDSSVEVRFNKTMLLSSLDQTQFTLHQNGIAVPAQLTFDGIRAVLNPDADLAASTRYTVTLNGGIVDNDGRSMETQQWHFYTDGSGWSSDAQLEPAGSGDALVPEISSDADGNAIVIWYQYVGSITSIYSNRYTVDSGWGNAELIESAAGKAFNNEVSYDADGNAIAVWRQDDGAQYSIYANRYTPATGWGNAELIETDNTGGAYSPQISFDAEGNAFAIWRQFDGSIYSLYANRYTIGSGWGSAELIESDNVGHALLSRISTSANGDSFAVWKQGDGTSNNIYSNHNASGSGWGSAALIETAAGHANYPQIGSDAQGNALAVWTQSDGTRINLYANRYTVGSGWGNAELIEANDVGDIFEGPQLSVNASGDATVIWAQLDGSRQDLYANSFTTGTGWGSAELIEIDDAGNAFDGQISVDADGDALAVWTQLDATGDGHLMSNRRIGATGWGGAVEIDAVDASGLSYGSSLTVSANGSAFVTWTHYDGTNFSIKATRFDPRVIAP